MLYLKDNIGSVALGGNTLGEVYKGSELVYQKKNSYIILNSSIDQQIKLFSMSKNTINVKANEDYYVNVNNITNFYAFCTSTKNLIKVRFENVNLTNNTKFNYTFTYCTNLRHFDFNDTKFGNNINLGQLCEYCTDLEYINFGNLEPNNLNYLSSSILKNCINLSYIRCKQTIKDYFIENVDRIGLPVNMKEGGSGIWEIVD